jgi:hypothetical protein
VVVHHLVMPPELQVAAEQQEIPVTNGEIFLIMVHPARQEL